MRGVLCHGKAKGVGMQQAWPKSVRSLFRGRLIVVAAALLFATRSVNAQDDGQLVNSPSSSSRFSQEDLDFFERKIRPVLVNHCFECHSDAAAKQNHLKGGLRVDSRDGLLRGGDSGPAIVPNKADESLLLKALRFDSFEMPPSGKLSDAVINDFQEWIARGAADPRVASSIPDHRKTIDLSEGRNHWSYRPLAVTTIPNVTESSCHPNGPIDAFILARLQSEELTTSPEANRRILIRRVYFDLIGLPPSPEEIDEFINDDRPDAFDRLVDRLLASSHFGVRWGRRWLSVVRFAESVTLRGLVFPEAWRYRDYVIEAFNADYPFDRFVIEQLAGDLLPANSLVERQRQCVATTFLALGNLNLEEQDKQQLRMDVVDEQLEAISKGFLAQTLTCSRCHDHKFDPIPARDYYAMAGILKNVKTLEDANVSKWLELPLPLEAEHETVFAKQEKEILEKQQRIAAVQESQKQLKARATEVSSSVTNQTDAKAASLNNANQNREEAEQLDRDLKQLKQDLKQLQTTGPRRPRYMSVQEESQASDIQIHIRGTVHNLGETVPRGFLQVISDSKMPTTMQSGRKEFGEWIVSRANPLTPRVLSNRIWYWLFGNGLSRTPENFGTTGDPPSHPELLDYLARRLFEREWALKPLIREVVLSSTYRKSADPLPTESTQDIENRWLAHQNRRRLDAECLLDSILTLSDFWNDELGGRTFPIDLAEDYGFTHNSRRRAAYWPVFRNSLPKIFEVFDFADPSLPSGVRTTSTVAPQSLFFLNNDWVKSEARRTAERILAEAYTSNSHRIERAFQLVLGRGPSDNEAAIALKSVDQNTDSINAWSTLIQAMFASIDFRYVE